MSIVVSPLLRVHNKTDFPIELRFHRPEQQESEYASLEVKAGDTIDDSTAAFDAIKASGGSKKTLTSLSVGMSQACIFLFYVKFELLLLNNFLREFTILHSL